LEIDRLAVMKIRLASADRANAFAVGAREILADVFETLGASASA